MCVCVYLIWFGYVNVNETISRSVEISFESKYCLLVTYELAREGGGGGCNLSNPDTITACKFKCPDLEL